MRIGEAPIAWQGNTPDLVEFAYRHPEHRAAIIRNTGQKGGTRCWTWWATVGS
jgi:hypothetical protein